MFAKETLHLHASFDKEAANFVSSVAHWSRAVIPSVEGITFGLKAFYNVCQRSMAQVFFLFCFQNELQVLVFLLRSCICLMTLAHL